MELRVDDRLVSVGMNETLLDAVQKLGLVTGKLSTEPIAAKIAGEIFTLNYVPVRQKEAQAERNSMRRAMAASGGVVRLLRYTDPTGKDVYVRTAQFVLFLALRTLWPQARGKMHCMLGSGIYFEVTGVDAFSVEKLKQTVGQIVEKNEPLFRRRMKTEEAIQYYTQRGQEDKARILRWRKRDTFDVYSYGDFSDYYHGELAPSTGYLRVWDIIPAKDGFIFVLPDDGDPDQVAEYREMPHFFNVFAEGKRWGQLMECETVADLNELVENGRIRELIRVNEALHEKHYAQIADTVCQRGASAVMLAGPSSSGKTTSANRLATQLRVHGKKPVLMSLDDYYIDRDRILPGPDGKVDLEHINTIDTALFGQHLDALLKGMEVEIPYFNFKTGKREWNGHRLQLQSNTVIIVEGLHALNPVLLPEKLDASKVYKMYISPLLPLNLDNHNWIPTSNLRLLRRIVRDYESRGTSVEKTIAMWDSVRRGEKRWIFPYQENADVIFNSSTLYELAVLKKHIFPLLTAVQPENESYETVRAIVKFLNYVLEADADDEIPPTSLVREFVGGNTYYR